MSHALAVRAAQESVLHLDDSGGSEGSRHEFGDGRIHTGVHRLLHSGGLCLGGVPVRDLDKTVRCVEHLVHRATQESG